MNLRDLADFFEIELEIVKVHYTVFIFNFSCKLMISILNKLYICGLFSVMEQMRIGEMLYNALEKKKASNEG